ncbi:HEAT repeat domain-containing protein [Glycomyces sp. L485]|uniref:HEAT repeat domain-containing protein n=1 Tax=Glycomyces sp. L485 TaxID=2909235 RepID=UPI001F4AAEB6|nr:HEAT repeat domain-containing protein [Glycomyces sp. L485]MCH7230791.1 HEAT repeat domain-containing protein [Glycomyces sp. L485]
MTPSLSVIVRFHNEITHIEAVLQAIRAQRTTHRVEIVAVDNVSKDGSREIAERYADQLIEVDDYRPGIALNRAIGAARGETIVIVSAHAIPENEHWLDNLTAAVDDPAVLAVYGAQVYPLNAKFLDKCDLDIFSDIRPRIETRDTDFWNANSAFKRSAWERLPFDETVIELEDHHWTKQLLPDPPLAVRFEPTATVYHYGHEARNDRGFLEPSPLTENERIDRARAVLEAPDQPWPAVMRAGMDLAALANLPHARSAVPVLSRLLIEHPDFDVRWRMAGALARIGDPAAVPHLVRGLEDPSFYPRDECAWALGRFGAAAVPELLDAKGRIASEHLPFLALALGLTGDPDGVQAGFDVVSSVLAAGDASAQRTAVYFLGEFPAAAPDDLCASVAERLESEDYATARAAAWCWGVLAERFGAAPAGLETVAGLAEGHADAVVRSEAVVALGRTAGFSGAHDPIAVCAAVLRRDESGRVRQAAAQTLRFAAEAGNGRAAEVLEPHASDPDFGVAFERETALSTSRTH